MNAANDNLVKCITMNQFNGAKKKLMQSILIPVSAMLFLVFSVTYTTITAIGYSNYQASIRTAIERKHDYFDLTLSLQVSSNSTITTSSAVIAYAKGSDEYESSVRSLLSQKLSQSPNLLGNQLYFIDENIEPISAYSVSGLPSANEILSLEILRDFLATNENHIFTIRHNFMANTYNFTQYPEAYGLATLFEKVYDEDQLLIGLLASDYSTQKLYDELFDFSYHSNFDDAIVQIKSSFGFLRLRADDVAIEGIFVSGLNRVNLFNNVYRFNIDRDSFVIVYLPFKTPLLTNIVFFTSFLVAILLLDLITYYMVRFSVNNIINPLEEINRNIKATLE